jgi:hypothetical protein
MIPSHKRKSDETEVRSPLPSVAGSDTNLLGEDRSSNPAWKVSGCDMFDKDEQAKEINTFRFRANGQTQTVERNCPAS